MSISIRKFNDATISTVGRGCPEFAIKESAEYRQDKGYRDKKPK